MRDEARLCKGSKSMIISEVYNSLIAEAMRFREVLSWVKSKGWNQEFVFEIDALMIIQALKSTNVDLSFFGSIITNCKALSLKPSFCVFNLAKRSTNCVTRTMACVFNLAKRSANCVTHTMATPISMSDFLKWNVAPLNLISFILKSNAINI